MADPKYAGLPGIAYDQPDVYETSELPESEQDYFENDNHGDCSPSIEVLHLSSSEAYKRFEGHILDPSNIDFSDRIKNGKKHGYSARRVEWEIEGKKSDESVVQRYQRLQCETDELVQEVQHIMEDIDNNGGKISASELKSQVENLHSTLVGLNLKDALGINLLHSLDNSKDGGLQKISDLLMNFKQLSGENKTNNLDAAPNVPPPSDASVTYELFYGPEHAKLTQIERAALLEKRLDKLESLVGNNPEKLSVLSTWTNHKSLSGAVNVLASRLALLDPVHLDHIEGRLHCVHTKMNQIVEKKSTSDDTDKQSSVSDLYDLMKKSEVLCAALPEIIDRVVSIEELHQEAGQFSHSLKQLDVAQVQLTEHLEANDKLLSAVQKNFMENLNNMTKNISNLQERVEKLKTCQK